MFVGFHILQIRAMDIFKAASFTFKGDVTRKIYCISQLKILHVVYMLFIYNFMYTAILLIQVYIMLHVIVLCSVTLN
jgi:hypothetical protein